MYAVCPGCQRVHSIPAMALKLSPTKTHQCGRCGWKFDPRDHRWIPQKDQSDNQRRSRVQEKKAAERYGARTQPASGARDAKSDIRKKGVLRGECKFTRARSFSLKLDELLKVEKEAAGAETPLFEVEFQGVHPTKRYVVLRAEDYAVLLETKEEG